MEKRKIEDLPTEILTQVLSNNPDQSHLAKITLVSKRFKEVVEPLLYRHISLSIRYSAKEFCSTRLVNRYSYTTVPSFVRYNRLINTLSLHPDICQQVRTLSLRVHRRLWYMLFAADFRLLKLLPGLRMLSLSPPPCDSTFAHSIGSLRSLRLDFSHVTNHYDETGEWVSTGVPLQILARCLRLPELRKVQLERVLYTKKFDGKCHFLRDTSFIVDLRLLSSYEQKSDRVLAALLRSIKCLQRLVFEALSESPRMARPAPSAGVFESALSGHRRTIEEFAVATSDGAGRIGWGLSSFIEWSSLKRLAVPGYMLRGDLSSPCRLHEKLPSLLEELQVEFPIGRNSRSPPRMSPHIAPESLLLGPWESMVDAIGRVRLADMLRLAEVKNVYVPRLNHVVWWYQRPTIVPADHLEYPTDMDLCSMIETSMAFEKVGIKFEWVIQAFFKDTPFGERLFEWQE